MTNENPLLSIRTRIKIKPKYGKSEIEFAKRLGDFSLREKRFNKEGKEYPIINVSTEKELVLFLRNNFGFGNYTVLGTIKGRRGYYVFWKGSLFEDGWEFAQKPYLEKEDIDEIEVFEKQLVKGKIDEDEFKNEIKKIKEFSKQINSFKKYGFSPYLTPSGRRGQINFWESPDKNIFDTNNDIKDVLSQPPNLKNKERKKFESMTIDEINNF